MTSLTDLESRLAWDARYLGYLKNDLNAWTKTGKPDLETIKERAGNTYGSLSFNLWLTREAQKDANDLALARRISDLLNDAETMHAEALGIKELIERL